LIFTALIFTAARPAAWRDDVPESRLLSLTAEILPMLPGLPDRELLESTHEFPCVYVFKAIGVDENHFVGRVLSAVKRCLDEGNEPSFSCRETAAGRHVGVTIEPEVSSAGHVLEIYQALREVEGLVMLL
jgi:putative lipoic acid-binding regulatory protein